MQASSPIKNKYILMKTWKLINKESEYIEALTKAIDTNHVAPGTDEYEEREFLLVLIKDYEEKHVNRLTYKGVY